MDNRQLQDLFAAVRGGDTEAFAAIYGDMKTPVYTVIYRIVGSHETAEDIMQELFLRLFRCPPESDVKNPRAYIFRAAHNMAIDHLRRDRTLPLDDAPPSAHSAKVTSALDARLDIETALRRLSDEERRVVILRLNADLTLRETADIMGRSIASVHRTYTRALKALKQQLQ
ncbi:MAG: sigma-70 family RNA polymerase sigma factor [Clostridia bacterium]|nr:sigma-70 family RNA polymerase sigma factor [Clostridia bacterium]